MAKCKFEDYVQPRLEEVQEMAAKGFTNLQIAKSLAISEATFYKFLRENPTFRLALVQGRQSAVQEIKAALFKKALGFTYTEQKKTTKKQGNDIIKTTETVEKYSAPSETAAAMLLRTWDAEYIDRDMTTTQLRKDELVLKERIASDTYFFDSDGVETSQNDENINNKE